MNNDPNISPPITPATHREQILSLLQRALEFTDTNLGRLDLLSQYWDEEPVGDSLIRLVDKVVIEAALMVMLVNRVSNLPTELCQLVDRLKQTLYRHIFTERNHILFLRFPKVTASLGAGCVLMHQLGLADMEILEIVTSGLQSSFPDTVERSPFREMDVRWVRGLIDRGVKPDYQDILPHSILTSISHPIYMDRSDAYALTHALMYLTDFGRSPCGDFFSAQEVEPIAARIDACLAWQSLTEDFDLLGEFLIDAVLMDRFSSPYAQFAWHLFHHIWDEIGFLPAPGFKAADFRKLVGDKAAAYAFQTLYHTNFVGGILCAVLLFKNGDSPPAESVSVNITKIQAAQQLCNHAVEQLSVAMRSIKDDDAQTNISLDLTVGIQGSPFEQIVARALSLRSIAGKQNAPWIRHLADAPLEDDALLLVLSDALLIHSTQTYQLDLLADIIRDRAAWNLPISSTYLVCAEFLARQQLPNGLIGAQFLNPEHPWQIHRAKIMRAFQDSFQTIIQSLDG